ncbi:MAG: acetate--CoA ligase family protein [Anaerolineaceae bacterium]|nr:acetate--CoA ligase family protein [Anaerolineaceae bacterium]
MAKLHEYQSKALLQQAGIPTPPSRLVTSAAAARDAAQELGAVVIKAQAWTTSRAAQGLIQFTDTPDEAETAAAGLLGRKIGGFTVEQVLVEARVKIVRECYLGLILDDRQRAPVLIFSSVGGSGIEDIARAHPDKLARHTINIATGLRDYQARDLARQAGIESDQLNRLTDVIMKFYGVVREYDARSAEINPLVLTDSGVWMALDARFTVDDYAVYRHPDLGIEMAREFDRPPTPLEKIAWDVEKNDYRGTFYFIQMEMDFQKGEGVIGFQGSGGGGGMMNMDALINAGFKVADFVDTSGNPPASKVYRAARIILSQPGIDGYYAGGSGVASQEQYHTARGLVKAFMDAQLNVPAVIRIGGNGETQAMTTLHEANGQFPAPVEAYGRDTSPETCTARLRDLIQEYVPAESIPARPLPEPREPYHFETVTGGTVTLDHALCRECESKICITTCAPQILSLEGDVPVLNITPEAARKGGCTECLACEVACYFHGNRGGRIHLPIQGLE